MLIECSDGWKRRRKGICGYEFITIRQSPTIVFDDEIAHPKESLGGRILPLAEEVCRLANDLGSGGLSEAGKGFRVADALESGRPEQSRIGGWKRRTMAKGDRVFFFLPLIRSLILHLPAPPALGCNSPHPPTPLYCCIRYRAEARYGRRQSRGLGTWPRNLPLQAGCLPAFAMACLA